MISQVLGEIILDVIKALNEGTPADALKAAVREVVEQAKVQISDQAVREELGIEDDYPNGDPRDGWPGNPV